MLLSAEAERFVVSFIQGSNLIKLIVDLVEASILGSSYFPFFIYLRREGAIQKSVGGRTYALEVLFKEFTQQVLTDTHLSINKACVTCKMGI